MTKNIEMQTYRPPRGTHDFLPDEMAVRNYVEKIIKEIFELHGFQQIQTPIFEEFALLAARSGEEIRESMFTFFCEDKEYALRPELTAPVCRLVASGKLEKFVKPYKLYYIGECFRYERPQAGRYRQFTQAGVELIGSSSPLADVEVIVTLMKIIDKLNIKPYKLKIGNIGIFRSILNNAGFNYDIQNVIISNIDNLISIQEKCEVLKDRLPLGVDDTRYIKEKINELYRLQEDIQYEGEWEITPQRELTDQLTKEWLNKLFTVAEVTYKTLWRKKYQFNEELVNLLIHISKIRCDNKDKIKEIATDVIKDGATEQALNNLIEVLNWLEVYGIDQYEIVLGIARGLDYYTGTVFEVDCPLLGAQKQLCGGGRYDELIAEFGGPHLPATGFALGFDRIVEALLKIKEIPYQKLDIFVAVTNKILLPKAIEITELLRKENKKVEIDIMDRDLKAQLGYASECGCEYTVIVGEDELKNETVTLRNMNQKKQEVVKINELIKKIKEK